jgi:hypothetical protein
MADEPSKTDKADAESIDYSKSQAEIDKAKAKARDEDAKRLEAEHE